MGYNPRDYIPDYSFIGRAAQQVGQAAQHFASATEKIKQMKVDKKTLKSYHAQGVAEAKRQAENYGIPWEDVRRKYAQTFVNSGKDYKKTLENWVSKQPQWDRWIKEKKGEIEINKAKAEKQKGFDIGQKAVAGGYEDRPSMGFVGPGEAAPAAQTQGEALGRAMSRAQTPEQQDVATQAIRQSGLPTRKDEQKEDIDKRFWARLSLAQKKQDFTQLLQERKEDRMERQFTFAQKKDLSSMITNNRKEIAFLEKARDAWETDPERAAELNKRITDIKKENNIIRTGNLEKISQLYNVQIGQPPTPSQQPDPGTGPSSTQPPQPRGFRYQMPTIATPPPADTAATGAPITGYRGGRIETSRKDSFRKKYNY